jgi:hypothetical protein
MMRAMVLGQIARTKSLGAPTFWGNAGNEGNQFSDVSENI